MAKKRKWSRNRSVLADIPIGETSWYEWRIELLLLAELAARKDGVDQAMNLFDSIEKRTGRQFDGSMSSWREISNATPTELVNVRAENPAFFFGLTNALLSMFNLTVPLPDGAVPDCTQTEMNRLALIEHMNEGGSPLSTRVKALHSLLFAKSRGNAEEIGEMEREARAVFERFDPAAPSSVRARWLAMRPMSRGVNLDYVAEFTELCLEMPCAEIAYIPAKGDRGR